MPTLGEETYPPQYERADKCPIDVYVASNYPYRYPYKLVKPEHVRECVTSSAETLIMDSGIGNDDVTNRDVLDLAEEYDADMVVAKDYLHEQDRTTESIREFMDEWEDHDCRATPLIPLQPPHHEHYQELPDYYHYLLGGMAFDYDTNQIISAVEKFREVAGSAPYVHLLGVGAKPRLMDYLAQNPGHVQSIDCSTPEQCAINGAIFDVNLERMDYDIRMGDNSTPTRSALSQHLAYTLCDSIRMRYEQRDQPTLGSYV